MPWKSAPGVHFLHYIVDVLDGMDIPGKMTADGAIDVSSFLIPNARG
jgi:hypothetical protein